jgi:hypothetical protein
MARPKKKFRLEKWSLVKERFKDVVDKVWSTPCRKEKPIDIWQFRVRNL